MASIRALNSDFSGTSCPVPIAFVLALARQQPARAKARECMRVRVLAMNVGRCRLVSASRGMHWKFAAGRMAQGLAEAR